MLLKTQILFNDLFAEKFGTDSKHIWGEYYLNLKDIIGFGEYIEDNVVQKDITEVILKGIGGRVINIPLKDFIKIYADTFNYHTTDFDKTSNQVITTWK